MIKKSLFNIVFKKVLSFIILLFIVLGLVFYIFLNESIKSSLETKHRTITSLFAKHIRNDLIFGMYSEVYRHCKSLEEDISVLSLELRDRNNKIICKTNNFKKDDPFLYSHIIHFDEKKERPLATLRISFSKDYSENLQKIIFSSFLFLLSLIGLFIPIGFRKIIKVLFTPLENAILSIEKKGFDGLLNIKSETNTHIHEVDRFLEKIEILARQSKNIKMIS